jgi:hypothetical protein
MVDVAVGRLVASAFGLLARLRGARALHPEGHSYAVEIETASTAPLRPGRYRGVVRLSRSIGLPEPWPDLLGLAVRMLDADGAGGMQDLLLVSSFSAVLGRHLLVPRRAYGEAFYSGILPVQAGSRKAIIGARPVWAGQAHPVARLAEVDSAVGVELQGFDLMLARPLGSWLPLARVHLVRPLPAADSASLDLNPYHQAAELAPVGVLNALRRRSYAASQRARAHFHTTATSSICEGGVP